MSYQETKFVYFDNPNYDENDENSPEEIKVEVTFEVTDYDAVYSGRWTSPADTDYDPIEFSVGDDSGLSYDDFCKTVGSERADQLIQQAIERF